MCNGCFSELVRILFICLTIYWNRTTTTQPMEETLIDLFIYLFSLLSFAVVGLRFGIANETNSVNGKKIYEVIFLTWSWDYVS